MNLNNKSRASLTLIGGLVAFGAALLVVARPAPAATPAQTASAVTARTIQTSGNAVVRVQPDKVTLRLGVSTEAAQVRDSQYNNARRVEAVIKALRAKGVAAQDIATDYYALYPTWDDKYRTYNTVVVTLRTVAKVSEVLSAAVEAGANSVDDVTFSTSRLRELRDQARAMAVQAALEKAQSMASVAKATLGDVLTIVEEPQPLSNYYGWWGWYGRNNNANMANASQNVIQAAPAEGSLPPEGEFSLGDIVVQAQVQVTTALK
jgi:uncharacterized protein